MTFKRTRLVACLTPVTSHIVYYNNKHKQFTIYPDTALSQLVIDEINTIELELLAKNQHDTINTTTTPDTTSTILSPEANTHTSSTLSEITPIVDNNEVHYIDQPIHDPVATLFPPSPAQTASVYVLHISICVYC